jgi:hypothetical protein
MIEKNFQLERKNIAPVQFIIEGYGDMATVTTLDPRQAVIRVSIIPDFIDDMNGLLDYLVIKFKMKELSDYHEK